jgi:signal transduction histidine kinase
MDKIRLFFSPPIFPDETRTRQARLLSFALNLHLLIALGGAVLFLLISHNEPVYSLAAFLTGLPVLGMRAQLRRGRVRLAAALFMTLIFATMPGVAIASHSSIGAVPSVAFQFLTIVMAGLLVSNWGQFWFLAATCALDGALLFTERQGWIPVNSTPTPGLNWVSQVLAFSAAAGLIWLANRLIRESFERARLENEERRRTEVRLQEFVRELEAKNAELESFTDTASRDLKIPLTEIRRHLKQIEQDLISGDRVRLRENVEKAAMASETMRSLLDELLFLAHIGRARNLSSDVPFGEIVRAAIPMVDGLRSNKADLVVADGLPVVHGDRPRLVEVARNLIEHAARATAGQAGARIEIGQADPDPDGMPVLFVRHNGRGIELSDQARAFGIGRQQGGDGRNGGVDLAIVKKIVEVHGGRIWIESQAGGGTTFFFTLSGGRSFTGAGITAAPG